MVGFIAACINPFLGLFTALSFWALFDTSLNLFRGLKWNYIGITANTDKKASNNIVMYWISKVIALIGCIYLILM